MTFVLAPWCTLDTCVRTFSADDFFHSSKRWEKRRQLQCARWQLSHTTIKDKSLKFKLGQKQYKKRERKSSSGQKPIHIHLLLHDYLLKPSHHFQDQDNPLLLLFKHHLLNPYISSFLVSSNNNKQQQEWRYRTPPRICKMVRCYASTEQNANKK